MARAGHDRPLYMISVAAELAGVHPQTLRIYERKMLVQPKRSSGNTRLYSDADIARLRLIQQLTQEEGINLAGVLRILALQEDLDCAKSEIDALRRELAAMRRAAGEEAAVRQVRTALVHVQHGSVVRRGR